MEREETGDRGRGCGFEKLRDEEKRSSGRGESCRTIVLKCVPLWWETKAGKGTRALLRCLCCPFYSNLSTASLLSGSRVSGLQRPAV